MDQVTRVRKYIKREQWKTLIQECQSSGMTVTAWCKANDICEQTYYRNLKLLREEVCNNLPVPFSSSLFLFCGKRRDRIKVLLWEGDGFVLLYKRLENGNFKWPRKESEVKPLSWQEFRWLMEGLELEQKHAIKPAKSGKFC